MGARGMAKVGAQAFLIASGNWEEQFEDTREIIEVF